VSPRTRAPGARLDRLATQLQETGRLPLAGVGVSLEELVTLASALGIGEEDLRVEDGELVVREQAPDGPQRFNYYLHDGGSQSERRDHMEGQGVRLSPEAWAAVGRPFYEVTLVCEVSPAGQVSLVEARL
jgi:hypothetical protein